MTKTISDPSSDPTAPVPSSSFESRLKNSLFLVDGSSLLFRAFYAITHLSNKDGFPTNALYGFAMMMLKMMERFSPTHIAVIWDSAKKTVRHEYYAEYKANRSAMPEDLAKQIAPIYQFLTLLGINQLKLEGYEADDIIGTLCAHYRAQKWPAFAPEQVVIVSPDKDLFQLLKPDIIVYDGMKEKFQMAADCVEKFGINPEQMIDFLALTGDSSDNIPGVKGIGPKTASDLLKNFGTLEVLYQNLAQMAPGKRKEMLVAGQESAFLSKRLATVILDCPLPIDPNLFVPGQINWEELSQFCTQYQLKAVLQKAGQISGQFSSQLTAQPSAPDQKPTGVSNSESISRPNESSASLHAPPSFQSHSENGFKLDTQAITDLQDLQALVKKIIHAKRFVIDLETTSLNPFEAQIVGIAIAIDSQKGFYIPLIMSGENAPPLLDAKSVWNELGPLLQNPQICKIGHNLKFDFSILQCRQIPFCGPFEDSMLMSYVLNPEGRHGMDALSLQILNHETITFEQMLSGVKDPSTIPKKKWRDITQVSLEEITQYSGEDAQVTFALFEKLSHKLSEEKLLQFYEDIELLTFPTLLNIELKGVLIDKAYFATLSEQYANEIMKIESKVTELAGTTVNLRSPKQLEVLLFEKLNLPKQRKTKTGYSTDVDVLEKLARLHPVPELILEHRELSKLKNTYLDTLPALVEPSTNRLHTHYQQTVTATGRLSSNNPNLQNIPVKTLRGKAIRYGFIAPPGFQLIGADYSQIELRILAHYCEDEQLLQAFAQGQDIHRKTASQVFKKDIDQVTDQERTFAKTINFGIIYGQTPYGLSQQLGISQAEARKFIDQYFASFPKIQNCMNQFITQAQTTGFVQTLLGRKRWIKDINSQNKMIKEAAQRTAINTPIQGSAADLIKIAMNQLQKKLQLDYPACHIILQVHDELVCEAPTVQAKQIEQLMRETMEGVIKLKVPLTVDTAIASNWGEL